MLKCALLAPIFALALIGPARALDVELYPLTGEVRLHNSDGAAVPFVFYQISSDISGGLNPSASVWKSITDNYDAPFGTTPGNGFIDMTHSWSKLSATSTQLTEGVFSPTGTGGSLAAYGSVGLGSIWNPHVVSWNHLTFDVEQDSGPVPLNVLLAINGDYNGDLVVNDADYELLTENFGSTTSLAADGNLNGIVDAADFVTWRKSLGQSLPLSGLALQTSTVPEPSTAVLFALALAAASALAARRPAARRAAHRCAVRR